MKAVILAGGKGTRGRPYTDYFPKAMIPVCGRPLIDHIVRYLDNLDFIEEIIILADFEGLGGQIKNYYQNYGPGLSFIQDAQCGTAGDLLHAEKKLTSDKEFVLWFVDNLCAVDLQSMRKHLQEKKSSACVATRTTRKEETGFAIVKDGLVKQFKEKPVVRMPMAECLGIYILGREIFQKIRTKSSPVDLSYDILQELSVEGRLCAYDIGESDWIDAESPAVLERNSKTTSQITRQMES